MELNVSVFRTSNAAIRHLPEFQINVLLSVEKSVSPFNYIIHNKIKQRSKKKKLNHSDIESFDHWGSNK